MALTLPIIILLNIPSWLMSAIRRDPTFEPPYFPKSEHPEEQAKTYADFIRKETTDVEIKRIDEDKNSYRYILHRRDGHGPQVIFWQQGPTLTGIEIEGFRCDTWHTEEAESLDNYFWIALAGLENGAYYRRTWLGRKQVGIFMPKAKMWAVSDLSPFSVEPAFRRRFPRTNEFRSEQKV